MITRQLKVQRGSLVAMAVLITINNIIQATAYARIFPSPAARAAILAGFTNNGALRAFYGYPFNIADATGWLAWRSMGFMAIVVGVWAIFIATGGLRADEENGRAELTLGQPQARTTWLTAAVIAVLIEITIVAAADTVGLIAVCVPQGIMTLPGTLQIGLQVALPAIFFGALGFVSSQFFGTTRSARVAGGSLIALAFLIRTAADTGDGKEWLRWFSPLGWTEEIRPSLPPRAAAIVALIAGALVMVAITVPLLRRRDIGSAILPRRDSRNPRRFLLGSPWQAAVRDASVQLLVWFVCAVIFSVVMGDLTKTVLDFTRSLHGLSRLLGAHFGISAFISSMFTLVQLAGVLLVATLLVGARGEEASGRLELLIATPLSRVGWLLSSAGVAVAAGFLLVVASALGLWAGAKVGGQAVDAGGLMAASLNCIPLLLLSAGVTLVVLALAPRATPFVYAPIALAFLWDALGTALRAPTWTLDISPFHALAVMPLQDFDAVAALTLGLLGSVLAAGAAVSFRRRDLAGG